MKTRINITCGLMTTLIVSLSIASAKAQDLRVDIRFSDPVDNQTLSKVPASDSNPVGSPAPPMLDLPLEVNAEFFLSEGITSDNGAITYMVSDIQQASIPFRDTEYTLIQALNMQLDPDGTLAALTWESEPLSTASVISQVLAMNSRSRLSITGVDQSTQQPYSFSYRESEVTITAIPEPSALAVVLGIGLAAAVRRKRAVA